MTLDEAIKHARHVAETVCAGCAEDHLQLAEWLEDYKRLKLLEEENQFTRCENCIYNSKGTDEYPCVECKERYLLKFEPKPKEPKLKMCPFCGIRGGIVGDGEGNYRIQCYHCLATTGWHVDKEKAIEAWNTRKGE